MNKLQLNTMYTMKRNNINININNDINIINFKLYEKNETGTILNLVLIY